MAHQYGTTLGVVRCAIPAVVLGAFSGVAGGHADISLRVQVERTRVCGQPLIPAPSGELADPVAAQDGWDETFFDLVQTLCKFFSCGLPAQSTVITPDQEAQIEMFIAAAPTAVVPPGCDRRQIEYHIGVANQARLLNGTYLILPPHMAQPADEAFSRIEAVLQAALDSLPEVAN